MKNNACSGYSIKVRVKVKYWPQFVLEKNHAGLSVSRGYLASRVSRLALEAVLFKVIIRSHDPSPILRSCWHFCGALVIPLLWKHLLITEMTSRQLYYNLLLLMDWLSFPDCFVPIIAVIASLALLFHQIEFLPVKRAYWYCKWTLQAPVIIKICTCLPCSMYTIGCHVLQYSADGKPLYVPHIVHVRVLSMCHETWLGLAAHKLQYILYTSIILDGE